MQILSGKRGIIFGAVDERSLAWHVASRCAEQGARLVLTNTEQALRIGPLRAMAEAAGWPVVACDATCVSDLAALLERAQELLGGKIDFILHAVAMSMNLRRHREYTDANYAYFQQTLDISAISLHKLLQTAMQQDAMAEGGSVVALSYIAAERYVEGYADMGDAKALLESIVRQMGAEYGRRKRVRVNAVSQSPTPTKAGGHWAGVEHFYRYADSLSPLGNATADDCADLCVALFSDFTRKLTMQTLYSDGGFARTALTYEMLDAFNRK